MIGDRATDVQLAENLGIQALQYHPEKIGLGSNCGKNYCQKTTACERPPPLCGSGSNHQRN
ncbi:hypothetical protein [Actinobacillus pleuropneumoniae]|uniref:hypothetical protein n=1 Tax=Actinobacillus pleuropneumoniae TaxID=715 RepID=UPI003D311F40